jgi:hypothetical protein
VVTAQHEGQESRPPPGGDLRSGGIELLAWGDAVGQLAVPDVSEPEVFQIALEGGRVGLDGVGGEAEVARPGIRPLPKVDAPLERDAVEDDAGLGEARIAGDEAR